MSKKYLVTEEDYAACPVGTWVGFPGDGPTWQKMGTNGWSFIEGGTSFTNRRMAEAAIARVTYPDPTNDTPPEERVRGVGMGFGKVLQGLFDGPADPTNPPHYAGFTGGAQPIDIAEHLTFNAGNAVKYLARACRTDGQTKDNTLQDLRKAQWYIEREINRIKEHQ